jgi:prepilin-type processing-associated H-X9-DG protein
VVIAIISILAALLLVTLRRAKEEADTSYCKNNLRQWGLALRMYEDDFQVFPPFELTDVTNAQPIFWHQRLQPYTKTAPAYLINGSALPSISIGNSIYCCPDYVRLGGTFDIGNGAYGYNQSGYYHLLGEWGLGPVILNPDVEYFGPGDVRMVREAEVIAPANMIAIGDTEIYSFGLPPNGDLEGGGGLWLCPNIFALLSIPSASVTASDAEMWCAVTMMKQRHYGMWNVVFCDGHVEGLQAKAMWYPQPGVIQRWNRDHRCHRGETGPF